MKQLYITFLLLLVNTLAFAQKDFRDGYIVQNGDTLKGQLDYRGSQRSSRIATYRATAASEEQTFSPTQIQGFGFLKEAKIFEAKQVQTTDSIPVSEDLFLEVLVKGQANLYFYRDQDTNDHFYLSKGAEPLKELRVINFKQKDPKTGKIHYMQQEVHKPILMQAFGDCPSITEWMVDQVKIGHNSLSTITQKYNSCMGNTAHSKVSKKLILKFGPAVAGGVTLLEYGAGANKIDFNGSLNPGAGFFLNLSSPGLSEKLSIHTDLLFTSSYFKADYEIESTLPGKRNGETWFDMKFLKVPFLLRYTYPKGKFKPFVNIGSSMRYVVQQENESKLHIEFGGSNRTTTEEALPGTSFRRYSTGLTAGAGMSYTLFNKLMFLEARYDKTDGISNFSGLPTTLQSYTLVLSYQL